MNDKFFTCGLKNILTGPKKLPTSNWLVVPIGHDLVKETINKSAVECLKREVSYVCAIGKVCEQIHDMFDEEIVWQKIQNGESIENEEDFVREPMTTWHNDFNEGVWFAITSAYDGYTKIKFIMCLDLTENGEKDQLIRILNLIQAGWLPK